MNLMDLYAKISIDDEEFSAGLDKAKSKAQDFAKKAKKAFDEVYKIGDKAFKGIGAAVATGTAALGAFVKSSVDTGMTFDKAMSQVAATMGYSTDELNTKGSEANQTFERLREAAIHYGETTAFTSTQAAEALNYMALAGYDAETSIAMLPNVLNLAAAGGLELGYASDMITDSQTALGLTLDETNVLMDQMARTASISNTSVGQLGEAILTVGGTAQNLKYGTTELNAVLGILADNGIKGSEAGTHLRNMLLSLANPTENADKWIKKLGVSFFDSEGNLKSFYQIFPELNAAMADLTQEQKLQAFADLFNVRDIASANALLSTTKERWRELGSEISSSQGSMEKMAQTQLDNLAGDITIFKSAMDGLKITISDSVTPALREFVQFGTDGIGKIKEAFASGGWEAALNAVSSVLTQMLNQFIAFIPQIANMATQFVSTFVSNIGSNIGSITEAANQILQAFVSGFNQIIDQILPILSQLVPTIANYIMTFKSRIFELGVQIIGSIAEGIVNNFDQIVNTGVQIIEHFANGISTGVPRLLEMAPQIIGKLISGLSSGVSQLTNIGVNMMNSIAQGLSASIPNLTSKVLPMIVQFTANLRENAGKLVDSGLNLIKNLALGISRAIPDLVVNIPTIVSNIAGIINDNAPKILATGVQIIGTLVMGIIKAIPTIVANIPKIIKAIIDVFTAFNWINLGKQIIQFLSGGIRSMVSTAGNAAKNIFDAIINFFKNLPKNLLNLGKNAIHFLSQGITGMRETIFNAASNIFNTIVTALKGLPSKMLDLGKNIVKGIWQGIKNSVKWLWDQLANFAGSVIDKVKGFFGIHSPSTVFAGIGKNMALGLGEGWDDEYRSISNDIEKSLRFNHASIGLSGGYGVGTYNSGDGSSDTETVTEYNMQVTINLNGSDYTSQRQIAEEISVQLQNLVNRRSAAWA